MLLTLLLLSSYLSLFHSSCVASIHGTSWDLSALSKQVLTYTDKQHGYTYDINLCHVSTKKCGINNSPGSVCQIGNKGFGFKLISEWSDLYQPKWAYLDSNYPNRGLLAQFNNGDVCTNHKNRMVNFKMVCNEGSTTPVIDHIIETHVCVYQITMSTSEVCHLHAVAMGPFTVILLLLLVAAVVYLIAGCYYKRVKLGVTNWVESIPHIEFWQEFPTHVKNGYLYVYDKITGKKSEGFKYESVNNAEETERF